MGRIRRHLTFANVVSVIALFVALGTGGAWAAATIGSGDIKDDAVKSRHIDDGQIHGPDIGANAVGGAKVADDTTGRALTGTDITNDSLSGTDVSDGSLGGTDVANDSLGGADVDESSLGTVPQANNAGNAGNADTLDGLNSPAFARSRIYVREMVTDGSANGNGTCPSGDLCFAGGYYCDSGDTMLSGGFAEIDNGTRLVASEPFVPNPQDAWRIKFVNNSTEDTITVYTVCADNDPAHV